MRRDGDGRVLRDIAGRFLRSLFDDETAETTQEYLVSGNHRFPHAFHKRLYHVQYHRLFHSRLSCNLCNDVRLCHVLEYFKLYYLFSEREDNEIIVINR